MTSTLLLYISNKSPDLHPKTFPIFNTSIALCVINISFFFAQIIESVSSATPDKSASSLCDNPAILRKRFKFVSV